jgi:phasin
MQEMPNFTEMPETVRNIMKASIDQARKAFETFISASQQVMANFEGAPNPATDGMKQLNEKIAEFTKHNADANFRFAMKLTDAKQLHDVVDIQNSHVRELMETYAKQLEELRALTTKIVQDSAKAVTAGMPGGGMQ